jgi:hypothetical protein
VSDACEPGWATALYVNNRLFHTFGFFSTADSFSSSNQRETAAVLRGLLYFRELLRHEKIRAMTIKSDNAATVCNLQRQGAGIALLQMTRQIFKLLQQLDIRIAVAHIPGKDNDLVDALSRMEVTGDYELKAEFFERGLAVLGASPTVDLFAHNRNNKIPTFVAMDGPLAQGAAALDAFSLDWATGLPYIFPPVQLLLRVLRKLSDEKARAVLVAPKWPSQPWWTLLQTMQSSTVELGDAQSVLSPGPGMTGSHVTLRLPPGVMLMAMIEPERSLSANGCELPLKVKNIG